MYDLYRKTCFSQKMFINGLNMGLPLLIEQRSFIKYLLAVKYKPCEIYRRMYDLYREACFSKKKKIFTNELNLSFPLQAKVKKKKKKKKKKKTVSEVDSLSSEKKVPSAVVSKEGHTDSLLSHERIHHLWFLWKEYNCR